MDQNPASTQPIKDLLNSAQNIYVLFPGASPDETVASALALYQALQSSQKNLRLASPTPVKKSDYPLEDIDQISTEIGNTNLVISLKVDSRDSIDKVSYNLDEEGKIFNLIIQPKKDHAPLSQNEVSYSYSGAQADLIFIVGAQQIDDLSLFQEEEPKFFSDTPTVAINYTKPPKFALYHFADSQLSSLAEVMGQFIHRLGFDFSQKSATSLLFALDQATQNLQAKRVTATTFELVAQLMKAGGQRQLTPTPIPTPITPKAQEVTPPTIPPTGSQPKSVPQDWLAPKIYKGTPPRV